MTVPNERSMTPLDLPSQGHLSLFLWLRGPTLVPQAMAALTSPRCTPRFLFLMGKPSLQCQLLLWALPCIQTKLPALLSQEWGGQRSEEMLGKEHLESAAGALGIQSSSFTKAGIGNVEGGVRSFQGETGLREGEIQ